MKTYNSQYMKNRRKNRTIFLRKILGDKCKLCSSIKNLEFDHINRYEKGFTISCNLDIPMDRLIKEVKKCQLLCKKCHLNKTISETVDAKHGTISRYYSKKHKCRCDYCVEANSKWKKENRNKRKSLGLFPN